MGPSARSVQVHKSSTFANSEQLTRHYNSEEEWEKVKQELVGFVMQRDEGLNAKIELLMKDEYERVN